jgi:outer membrane lipopolysaccharide assembly protein LptE/RlpB
MCEPFQILDANPKVQQMGVEICRDFFQGISSLTSSTTESAAADDNDILCFFFRP